MAERLCVVYKDTRSGYSPQWLFCIFTTSQLFPMVFHHSHGSPKMSRNEDVELGLLFPNGFPRFQRLEGIRPRGAPGHSQGIRANRNVCVVFKPGCAQVGPGAYRLTRKMSRWGGRCRGGKARIACFPHDLQWFNCARGKRRNTLFS